MFPSKKDRQPSPFPVWIQFQIGIASAKQALAKGFFGLDYKFSWPLVGLVVVAGAGLVFSIVTFEGNQARSLKQFQKLQDSRNLEISKIESDIRFLNTELRAIDTHIDNNKLYKVNNPDFTGIFAQRNEVSKKLIEDQRALALIDKESQEVESKETDHSVSFLLFSASILTGLLSIGGLTVTQRNVYRAHNENYRKDLLKDFLSDTTVMNAQNILEAISSDGNYLPYIHLEIGETASGAKKPLAPSKFAGGKPIKIQADRSGAFNINSKFINTDSVNHLLGKPEKLEIVPTLQTLLHAFTPDGEIFDPFDPKSGEIDLGMLEQKIALEFDGFLEKYTIVGALAIRHLKQKNHFFPRDIDNYWNALDLPYWSSLMINGTDGEEPTEWDPTVLLNDYGRKYLQDNKVDLDDEKTILRLEAATPPTTPIEEGDCSLLKPILKAIVTKDNGKFEHKIPDHGYFYNRSVRDRRHFKPTFRYTYVIPEGLLEFRNTLFPKPARSPDSDEPQGEPRGGEQDIAAVSGENYCLDRGIESTESDELDGWKTQEELFKLRVQMRRYIEAYFDEAIDYAVELMLFDIDEVKRKG